MPHNRPHTHHCPRCTRDVPCKNIAEDGGSCIFPSTSPITCEACALVDQRKREGFIGFVGDRVPSTGGGAPVWVIDGPMKVPLDPRYDVRNHSPDGFQWGYGGSGPAQLALAICCNVVGRERAERVYQTFKFNVVARWDDTWELTRADALAVIEMIEAERAKEEE